MGYNIDMRKTPKIQKIQVEQFCTCCNAQKEGCKLCKGTGKVINYHYIISDGKIAIDGDTLK